MSKEQIQYVPLTLIHVERQVRESFDDEKLQGLMVSIQEVGQLCPIRVRKGSDQQLIIVDGERRFRALANLGMTSIAVIVEGAELDEAQIVQRQLIANVQRDDLSVLEKARGIRTLMTATGWNASQTAQRLGLSNGSLSRLLAILTLPNELQEQIAKGEIAASAAYELSRVADAGQQAELAQKVVSGRMTRDGLQGARKARQASSDGAVAAPCRVTALLGEGRTITVASPNLDMEGFIGLLEDLLNRARRVRTQGVALHTFARMLKDQVQT